MTAGRRQDGGQMVAERRSDDGRMVVESRSQLVVQTNAGLAVSSDV